MIRPWRLSDGKGNTGSKRSITQGEYRALPDGKVAAFSVAVRKEWEGWDKGVEAHSQAGRLDFLVREARDEYEKTRVNYV
jgi:hypothetical protein